MKSLVDVLMFLIPLAKLPGFILYICKFCLSDNAVKIPWISHFNESANQGL